MDQSKRSFSEYSPALNRSSSGSQGIFIADAAEPEDYKRCTAYNAVTDVKVLLDSDRPVLTMQVTRFSDATLITYSFNHLMGDIFAIKDICTAWQDALNGKPITPWERLDQDPFTEYGPGGKHAGEHANAPSPPLPPGWRIFGLVDKVRFLSRMLWDIKHTRPEKNFSQKYVFIPDAEVHRLVEEAKRDLLVVEEQRKKQGTPPPSPLKVTRSNVIYAWILKHNHEHLDPEQISTPVTVANARGRPPTGFNLKTDTPPHNWWNGSYLASLPSLKVRDLRKMSLGELALHVREGTDIGSTPESARRMLSFGLHNGSWKNPTGKLAFWSPPNHCWSGLTDWRAAGFHQVDFAAARLSGSGPVSVCCLHITMAMAGSQRDRWACVGDFGGGTWVMGMATDAEWRLPTGFGKYPHHQRAAKTATSLDEYSAEPL